MAHRAGVQILASSDASFVNPYLFHGFSLIDELDLYVKIGLTPQGALHTATIAPPRFFGLANQDGTMAAGRRVDLVPLGANPLEALATLRRPQAVVVGGRLDRQALDALGGQLVAHANSCHGSIRALLGISDDDLDALLRDPEALGGDGPIEGEDDVPELPVAPVSVPGDLWQLGPHRLICGDSTSTDVVRRLLGDVKPLLMVTDPPYGVEYDPSWRNQAGAARTRRTGKVLNDDRADWREVWALFTGDVAYVWHGAA
jgi:hypothetical protein